MIFGETVVSQVSDWIRGEERSRGCRVCCSCPRPLSRTANAAEIARSHWLQSCRGVGDGYVQVRCSCLTEGSRAFSPSRCRCPPFCFFLHGRSVPSRIVAVPASFRSTFSFESSAAAAWKLVGEQLSATTIVECAEFLRLFVSIARDSYRAVA